VAQTKLVEQHCSCSVFWKVCSLADTAIEVGLVGGIQFMSLSGYSFSRPSVTVVCSYRLYTVFVHKIVVAVMLAQ